MERFENERDIDEKQRQIFRNLTVAHKSNLLVFSKDPARYVNNTAQLS